MNLRYIVAAFGILLFAGFLFLGLMFFFEGSKRAALRSFLAAIIIPEIFILLSISEVPVLYLSGIIVTFVTIFFIILLIIPFKGKKHQFVVNKDTVIDERNTMFSRNELKPGTGLYSEYYQLHPQNLEKDNKWRSSPGLLARGSLFYKELAFAAANASFSTVKLFASMREEKLVVPPIDIQGINPQKFIREWSKKIGAAETGFTEMRDYHYYTIAGRNDRYGNEIKQEFKFGIVFLVEMDSEMISTSPRSPVVMESANQYLRSAAVATQVAVMIRSLGYSAKTHIDANYDVICPLVARDAGLGEIGRNGLLISEKYGPRVRISVVTTDLPLKTEAVKGDSSVVNFCSICKKCAVNCPVQCIPFGPAKEINGNVKWQLDQESCFSYWSQCGTDCGRCISTCPYSHKNNWFHNLIRRGISNNILFLNLAKHLDDFFYGERPIPKKLPDLMQ